MNCFYLSAAATALTLAACSTTAPEGSVSPSKLNAALARPDLSFAQVQISCEITDDQGTTTIPNIIVAPRASGAVKVFQESAYPDEFAFPEIPGETTEIFPVTPAKPTQYQKTNLGWELDIRASPRKGFVQLSGKLIEREFGAQVRAAGVPFSMIVTEDNVVITENRVEQPVIKTQEIPVNIAAIPGETYSIGFDGFTASFRCEILR